MLYLFRRSSLFVLAAGLSAIVVGAVPALAQDSAAVAPEQELGLSGGSLQGLQGFFIFVDELAPEVVSSPLTEKQIYDSLGQALLGAGIDVLHEGRYELTPESAVLYVFVNTMHLEGVTYIYNLGLAVIQEVSLARDPEIMINASTWRSEEMGMITQGELKNLNEHLLDKLNGLIEDFQAENPAQVK